MNWVKMLFFRSYEVVSSGRIEILKKVVSTFGAFLNLNLRLSFSAITRGELKLTTGRFFGLNTNLSATGLELESQSVRMFMPASIFLKGRLVCRIVLPSKTTLIALTLLEFCMVKVYSSLLISFKVFWLVRNCRTIPFSFISGLSNIPPLKKLLIYTWINLLI